MTMAAPITELGQGFWIGLGVATALAVFGLLQLLFARAAHRG